MKRMVVGAALLAAAPFAAQAQSLQPGGVYVGLEGGANWMFNSSFNSHSASSRRSAVGSFQHERVLRTPATSSVARSATTSSARASRLEGAYRANNGTLEFGGVVGSAGINFQQINVMGNFYYDFLAGSGDRPLYRRRRRCRVPQRGRSRQTR